MGNVLMMNQGMTIRAKHLKILIGIIFSISVFMVYTQDFFDGIISTYFAFFNKTPKPKGSTQVRKAYISFRSPFVKSATFRCTEFIAPRRRSHEKNSAICARIFTRSFSFLRAVITQTGTIFGFVASRGNMLKKLSADFTIRLYFYRTKLIFAYATAIFRGLESVYRDVKIFFTSQALNNFTSKRFIHAIIQR